MFLLQLLQEGDMWLWISATHQLKCSGKKEVLEKLNIKVFNLPPYSPDLNPIEKMWFLK